MSVFLTLPVALAALAGGTPQAAEAVAPLLGRGFVRHETPHFSIVHDLAGSAVRKYAEACEDTYAAVSSRCQEWGFSRPHGAPKLNVILFSLPRDYSGFIAQFERFGDTPLGYYSREIDLAIFPALASAQREGTDADAVADFAGGAAASAATLVVRHEIAHQALYSFGVHVRDADSPMWLAEGLACQFETTGQQPNPWRLADLRESSSRPPWKDLILSGDRWEDATSIVYAQAWALVYYLLTAERESFRAYLQHVSQRKPGVVITGPDALAEFESVFGPMDDTFERRLESTVRLPPRR